MPGSVFEISFNIYYDICYRLLALNRYLFQRNLIFGRATYHSCNFKQFLPVQFVVFGSIFFEMLPAVIFNDCGQFCLDMSKVMPHSKSILLQELFEL